MITLLACLNLGFADFRSGWNKIPLGISESGITGIFIHSEESPDFWIVTEHSVYQVRSMQGRYSAAALSSSIHSKVNDVLIEDDAVYLAADDGLYVRAGNDEHFQRIFSSSDERQRQCLTVARSNGAIYLGTQHGLFIKRNERSSWEAFNDGLSGALIRRITVSGRFVYAVNSKSLFRIDAAGGSVREVFTLGLDHDIEPDEDVSDEVQSVRPGMIDVKIRGQRIYLATQEGIYVSEDHGYNWAVMSSEGLPYAHVKRLLILNPSGAAQDELMAATDKGIFHYAGTRWVPVYQGLESNQVADLVQDVQGKIYAATDRGLFILHAQEAFSAGRLSDDGKEHMFRAYADIEQYFSFEPSIREVQEMAVDYAEVHPDKIKKWRKQAQLRALAPSLSTGLNRSATDKYHWDTGSNPDALIKGREYLDWDVGLSWDLGDLIWNGDQTSIDSRSKLMVELREDVLDQVTRIYFERRRIQIELLSVQGDALTPKIEQQMRVAELTAIIDGFTGGEFSKRVGIRG